MSHTARNGVSKITLRIVADQNQAYIDSEDSGGGITANALPHIFEPFLP